MVNEPSVFEPVKFYYNKKKSVGRNDQIRKIIIRYIFGENMIVSLMVHNVSSLLSLNSMPMDQVPRLTKSCSTQLSMKLFLLLNVKMPTHVNI